MHHYIEDITAPKKVILTYIKSVVNDELTNYFGDQKI